MLQKKEDIRSRRTRGCLRQALIDLTVEEGYDAVTVTKIAEKAMINRATFYRYYEDKDDLLFRGLDSFFDSFVEAAVPPAAGASPDALVTSLEHIRRNAEFYRVMLGSKGFAGFQDRIRHYHFQIVSGRLEAMFPATRESEPADLALLNGFAAGALGGIIRTWVDNGCVQEPGRVAALITGLIAKGVSGYISLS